MIRCNLCNSSFEAETHVRWRKDGFDIVQCPTCTLLFRRVIPSRDDLTEIYSQAYFLNSREGRGAQGYLDYVAEAPSHRELARQRIGLLSRSTVGGHLLDVGAAAGFFVAEARNRGWAAEGVEISEPMVNWGREHLQVELALGDLRELELPTASFDTVTMWDYIEHSRDPAADLERAWLLLRPGGHLALSTGDVSSLVARMSRTRWHLLTPRHHNFFFSAGTIRALLERVGFDAVYIGHPGASYSLEYLLYKARTLIDVAPVRALAAGIGRSPLSRVQVPMNLFDIVTVVARNVSSDR